MMSGAAYDFAKGLIATSIKLALYGNKDDVIAERDRGGMMEATMIIREENVAGYFKGDTVAETGGGCLFPKWKLRATGHGEFDGDSEKLGRVSYTGKFMKFMFDDPTGNAEYFVGEHFRYFGVFRKGMRSGQGKLQRWDVETNKFFLYYDGLWKEDEMDGGIIYSPEGLKVVRVRDGNFTPIEEKDQIPVNNLPNSNILNTSAMVEENYEAKVKRMEEEERLKIKIMMQIKLKKSK